MLVIPEVTSSPPASAQSALPKRDLRLSREDFLKLLTAQLTHQDPMEPLNNQEFIGQLASLESLESTYQLRGGLDNLLKFSSFGTAASLIGKHVRGVDETGAQVTGMVEQISLDKGKVQLVVAGKKVPLSGVTEVLGKLKEE